MNKSFKRIIGLISYVKPYIPVFLIALLCMVVYSVSNGLVAYISGPAVSALFQSGNVLLPLLFDYKIPIEIHPQTAFKIVPLLLIVAFFIKGVSYFGQSYLMDYLSEKCVRDIRNRLYGHIQILPLDFFTSATTGNIISKLINDINLVKKLLSGILLNVAGDTITIIVLAVLAFNFDWELAMITIVVFPAAAVPIIQFGRRMRKISNRAQNVFGRIISTIHEMVTGIRIVKAFGMENHEQEKFSRESHNLFRSMIKISRISALSIPLMEFLGALGIAGVIFYSGIRINRGDLNPANLVSFFVAVFLMYLPLKRLTNFNNNLQQGLTGLERIDEIFEASPEPLRSAAGKKLDRLKDSITFRDVFFKYGRGEVLRGINISVKSGEKIAVVGATGAGKTTLLNLLPRFYDVTEGNIYIDGVDIREFNLSSLRSQISIVTQQVVLFNDTIKSNILYGNISKDDADVEHAARSANADVFIKKLPQGFDTVVGESGVRLSGGEKQKLAIARAILKDAPILILDEATSSLDSVAEEEIQIALENLMKGRTTFIIAHRLSTVKNADRIYVLSDGTIKETGTHSELLSKGGIYFKLYSTQFRGDQGVL